MDLKSRYFFYADAAKIALQSITAHKLRTFLTLIGIIIGVASVVVVGASLSGFNTYITTTLTKILGINHFTIWQYASQDRMTEEQWERVARRRKPLYLEDYKWLRDRCESCKEVGALARATVDLERNGRETFGTVIQGVTENMDEIEDKIISEGRFIAAHEVEHSSLVCIIGVDLKEKLFEDLDPLGKTIKISGVPMTVIGVEEKRGTFMGNGLDNHAYIPITTYGRLFGRRQSLVLHGKAESPETLDLATDEARQIIRNRYKLIGNDDDTFGVENTRDINNQVDQFANAVVMVVTPITLLSLIVGGIVVMNIMLVSVTERTFEVGLRKAMGARRSQILMQFLIESSLLSAVGGVLGLLLAAGVSWIVRIATPIPMTITLFYILLSLIVSGGIGVIAGIYPAYKASRLDPIVALSAER
jgi:putative ABC transport system permease protein